MTERILRIALVGLEKGYLLPIAYLLRREGHICKEYAESKALLADEAKNPEEWDGLLVQIPANPLQVELELLNKLVLSMHGTPVFLFDSAFRTQGEAPKRAFAANCLYVENIGEPSDIYRILGRMELHARRKSHDDSSIKVDRSARKVDDPAF